MDMIGNKDQEDNVILFVIIHMSAAYKNQLPHVNIFVRSFILCVD